MSLWQLILGGTLRNKGRLMLTVLGVASVIAGLVLVRTVSDVWTSAIKSAAENRLIVRSALPLEGDLPLADAARIAGLDSDVVAVVPYWQVDIAAVGARPRRVTMEAIERERYAADARVLALPADLRDLIGRDPTAVIAPREVAAELGWKIGTRLQIARRHGSWRELVLAATFQPADRRARALVIHREAANEALDTSHELIVTIATPALSAMLAKKIDAAFADARVPTVTQSEHQVTVRTAHALGGLFRVIDLVSATLLALLAAVVAGMIVFSTDERTTEYAVLRAIGFSPAQVGFCVSAEALLMATAGALLGLLIGVLGTFVIELFAQKAALDSVLPETFRVAPATLALGFLAATSLAFLSSLLPAIRASRVAVAEELRRQG